MTGISFLKTDKCEINDPAKGAISLILDTFVPLIYICRSYWKKLIKATCHVI
jgi:hypothetical protein